MAQRFGGRYSPGAGTPAAPKRLNPAGARVNFLFVVPFVFAIKAFVVDPAGFWLNLGAFGLLLLAAALTRDGVLAHAAFDARDSARKPAIPRKIFAAALTGLALALAALGGGVLQALGLGALGAALHLGAFGPDPLRDKFADGVDGFQADRVDRAVQEAETHLADMAEAIRQTADRALVARIDSFSRHVRALLKTVQDDPRRLSTARRYLAVYLIGARDATTQFVALYNRTRNADVRNDFEALLDDLEGRFALRREALLRDDRQELDIEIEVLRERLQREAPRSVSSDRTP